MANNRLHNPELIKRCCAEVASLPGDAAEIGVYRGDSAAVICEALPGSTVWLFDTFRGFTDGMLGTVPEDSHWTGSWRNMWRDTSVEIVEKRLNGHANRKIIAGAFPKSAFGLSPQLRFAHIDVDVYPSTLAALQWAWPLLVPGGIIIDDDYGNQSCGGARRAVDEFCRLHEIEFEFVESRAIIRRLP